jgi:glutamine amidotransferase
MTRVALIDYGSGNLHSCARALAAAAGSADEIKVTNRSEDIETADRVVLPGVGHFADCAAALAALPGLVEAMDTHIVRRGRPFLGICVGLQLMMDFGLEDGRTEGLCWIPGKVAALEPAPGRPVPHVGWNEVELRGPHPVLDGLGPEPHAYFTHSYACKPRRIEYVAAWSHYGDPIAAALTSNNLFGTQFHPEKSQKVGLTILSNFLKWTP